MGLFDRLTGRKTQKQETEAEAAKMLFQPEQETGPAYDFSTPGLSRTVTFGINRAGEAETVVLNRPEEDYHRIIVNHKGCFENFPGIVRGKWTACLEGEFDFESGKICFRTSFERQDRGYRCLWEIQPDGRYWADADGFGMRNDSEIILYADLDENGRFIAPFRIYEIDGSRIEERDTPAELS